MLSLQSQGIAGYVYPNFYGSAAAQSLASLVGTVIILVICAPTAVLLSTKFGKKEVAFAFCIVPAIGFVLVAIVLFFLYPLGKAKVEENVAELKRRRGETA